MNDDCKKVLSILRIEREYDIQQEIVHITKGTQETILLTSKKLNISYEEAIEILIYFGSNLILK